MHSDGAGHTGSFPNEAVTALYQDGERIAERNSAGGSFTLPSEPATYRVEIDSRQSMFELSPEQSVAWTFASAHVAEGTSARLPLLIVRFEPALSERGAAPAGVPFTLPLSVDRYGQEGPPEVGAPTLEVSFDDGATWISVLVEREPDRSRWNARLDHPSDAAHVSLRASAGDDQGNRVEQTVLRAYRLALAEEPP